jgi:hypothetical protein
MLKTRLALALPIYTNMLRGLPPKRGLTIPVIAALTIRSMAARRE